MNKKNLLHLLFLALTIQPALSADQSTQFKLFDEAQFFKQWVVKKTKGQQISPQENKRATKIGKKISIAVAIALTAITAGIAAKFGIKRMLATNQEKPLLSDYLEKLDKQNELTIEKLKKIIAANPDLIALVDSDGETFMLGFLRVSDESEENKLELLQFAVEQKLDLSLAPYLDQAIKNGYQKIADYLQQKGLH